MSTSHTPPTRPGSAVSISTTGATVATTMATGGEVRSSTSQETLGDALRRHTSWQGLTVYTVAEVGVEQCSILLHEDTLAALQSGDVRVNRYPESTLKRESEASAEKVDGTVMASLESPSLVCRSLLEHGHGVRLNVRIDNRIPFGAIALSYYDAVLLKAQPGAPVLCKLQQDEEPTIRSIEFVPFSESLYACGNGLELDYIEPFLRAHSGLLLYEKQILRLNSPKCETALLVQVAKLHLERLEGDEKRGRTDERSEVLSGRLGREIPRLKVDEGQTIPFNHPYRFNDDDESVVLGDSD